MSEVKFKVGDKVYCPMVTNKIVVINSKLHIQYTGSTGDKNVIVVFHNGKWSDHHHNPIVFPATQEWYSKLVHVYPNLEKPPVKKSAKEIIEAMLDSGWNYAPCLVGSRFSMQGKDLIYSTSNDEGLFRFNGINGLWEQAIPFDPKTGKIIIDYVDGEVVLESENE